MHDVFTPSKITCHSYYIVSLLTLVAPPSYILYSTQTFCQAKPTEVLLVLHVKVSGGNNSGNTIFQGCPVKLELSRALYIDKGVLRAMLNISYCYICNLLEGREITTNVYMLLRVQL